MSIRLPSLITIRTVTGEVTKLTLSLFYFWIIAISFLSLQAPLNRVYAEIRFEEVTDITGIDYLGQTWGASWGDYNGDGFPDLWLSNHQLYPSLYRNNRDGTFTDVAESIFLEPINTDADTHGSMWADIDNDGDQDIFEVSGGGSSQEYCEQNLTPALNWLNNLFISTDGGLAERAEQYGLSLGLLRSRTPQFIDFNYDGMLDVFVGAVDSGYCSTTALQQDHERYKDVTSTVQLNSNGCKFFTLADLSNNGNPYLLCMDENQIFPDYVYDTSVIPFQRIDDVLPHIESARDLAVEDFDGNGELDLLVTKIARTGRLMNSTSATQVDSQQINARFVAEGTEHAITFKSDGNIQIVLFKDYPNVMPTDVFIGKDGRHPEDENPYWVEFTFTLSPHDPSVTGRATRPENIDNAIFIDYDPAIETWTIAVSNSSSAIWKTNARIIGENGVSDLNLVGFDQPDLGIGIAPSMYLNNGFTFTDNTTYAGLNDADHCESVTAGDFDNDMDIDIYLVCFNVVTNLPNQLYENIGQGVFTKVADSGGAVGSRYGIGDSVVSADYDQDGCLDLFVANGNWSPPFYNGPHQLFRNICTNNGNHWLEVDLEGVISNRDAIGAKIIATAGGISQLRMLSGGMHMYSQNHQRIHFGLGQNERIDQITIYWPNGVIQGISDIPADQLLKVIEDVDTSVVGRPNYTAALSDGAFLWREPDENIYHLRVSAPNGPSHEYRINLIANAPPLSVMSVKLESDDRLSIKDNGFVFISKVRGGEDAVTFHLPANSEA
ncbi:MAG: CRTAC1 family protein, partial [Candidatus Thiodiazotropha sp.]